MATSILDSGTSTPQAGLVSIGKLAQATGLHEQTIRRLDQHLPSFLLPSGHRRYRLEEVLLALRKIGFAGGEQRKDQGNGSNGEISRSVPILCVIRVSTAKLEQRTSLVAQKERLTRYVAEQFGNVPVEISWNERTASGLNLSHPKVLEMIDLILSGRLDGGFLLCCFKDRLCRYGWEVFERLCQLHNIQLRFIDELDRKTESEELQQDLLAILTTFTARANGQKFRKLYGVKIDEQTAELILKFHSQKASITTIEKELALAGKSTDENGKSINAAAIYRWLRKNGKVVRKLKRLNPESDDVSSALSSGLDSLGQFVRAKLVKNEGRTKFKAVYDAYAEFCRVHSLFTLSKNHASTQLRNAGYKLALYNGYLCVAAQMVK